MILSPIASQEPPRYRGLEFVTAEENADLRIFGKPTTRLNRRMGVVLCYAPNGSDLDALRDRCKAAAARVRQAEGAVSEVESYIGDAMVYSPVAGEVSTIIAEQGELVGSGYPVVAILDMSDLWVTFNVKETLLPGISLGMHMVGYVPALDADVEFEVTYIAPQADFATWAATRTQGGFDIRTFAIKAKPVSQVENMRPGMSVLVDWEQIQR